MYLERFLREAKLNGWDKIFFFEYPTQNGGCTPEQISELEKETGLKLPLSYKEFLHFFGNGLGDFLIGSDFYYDQDLVELQSAAREILVENKFPRDLPDDAYVFWMHGGYMFCFFRTSEGNDPPVHFYRESFNEDFAWNYHSHFTDFLIARMKADANHRREAKQIEERLARDWQNA